MIQVHLSIIKVIQTGWGIILDVWGRTQKISKHSSMHIK